MKTILIAAAIAAAALASAQAPDIRPQKGASELSLAGSLMFNSGTNSSTVLVGYGYYLTNSLLINLGGNVNITTQSGQGSNGSVSGTFGPRYYFNSTGKTAPYVFFDFSSVSFESDGNTTSDSGYDYGVGLEFFQSKHTSVFVQYLESQYSGTSQGEVDFGLRVIFGG